MGTAAYADEPRWLAMHGQADSSDAIVRNIEAIVERQSGKPLLAMAVADRIQRQYLIVVGALVVIAWGTAFAQVKAVVPLILLGVSISFAGQIISVCYYAYQAELFPTAVRCRANGIVYSASRGGAMMSGFSIAFLLRDFGLPGVFAGITACMVAVAVSIGLFGPKTNGLRLEELNR